ncbi:MAG: hypothetical protein J6Q94_09840 [Clostridia bacterium]|nr:hypothetical protein [Clostridia bacterium]
MMQLMGVSLISAVLFSVIKKYSPEYSVLAEIAAVLLVLIFSYPYIKNIIDFYYEYTDYSGISSDYVKIVIKTIGVAILTQFASDLCKNSGQFALADKIEFAGKLIMATFAIPMAQALIEIAVSVIKME